MGRGAEYDICFLWIQMPCEKRFCNSYCLFITLLLWYHFGSCFPPSVCVSVHVCVAFYSFAFPPFFLLCCYFEIHHDFEIKHSTSMMRKMESSMSKHIGFGPALFPSLLLPGYVCVCNMCIQSTIHKYYELILIQFYSSFAINAYHLNRRTKSSDSHMHRAEYTRTSDYVSNRETHNILNNELDCGDDMMNQHWKSIISLCAWKTLEKITKIGFIYASLCSALSSSHLPASSHTLLVLQLNSIKRKNCSSHTFTFDTNVTLY